MKATVYSKIEQLNFVFEAKSGETSPGDILTQNNIHSGCLYRWINVAQHKGWLTPENLHSWQNCDDRLEYCKNLLGAMNSSAQKLSIDQRKELVKEFISGVESAREFSERNGLKIHMVSMWKKELLEKKIITPQEFLEWECAAIEKREASKTQGQPVRKIFARIKANSRRTLSRNDQMDITKDYLSGKLTVNALQAKYSITAHRIYRISLRMRKINNISDTDIQRWRDEVVAENEKSMADPTLVARIRRKIRRDKATVVNAVVECMVSGKQQKAVAFDYGVSRSQMSVLLAKYKDSPEVQKKLDELRENNVDTRDKRLRPERTISDMVAAVKDYHVRSKILREVCREHGIGATTFYDWTLRLLATNVITHDDISAWHEERKVNAQFRKEKLRTGDTSSHEPSAANDLE